MIFVQKHKKGVEINMSEEEIYSDQDENDSAGNYKENDFIDLNDLVYAPLYALAKSNQQLRASVVEAIKSMGTVKQNGKDESIQLKNINIAYEQMRQEDGDDYSVDNLQMQVPLLSIVPITSLNVEKAQIEFSTEVKVENDENGQCRIMARICAPEQREGDHLPRVNYKLKVGSLAATEGIMRITDLLSANQIAKKLDTTPIDLDGNLSSVQRKNTWQEISSLKTKVKKLKQLYQRISDVLEEQERTKQMSENILTDNACELNRDKYLIAQSNIANRIMEYQDQIMSEEIAFGLESNFQ